MVNCIGPIHSLLHHQGRPDFLENFLRILNRDSFELQKEINWSFHFLLQRGFHNNERSYAILIEICRSCNEDYQGKSIEIFTFNKDQPYFNQSFIEAFFYELRKKINEVDWTSLHGACTTKMGYAREESHSVDKSSAEQVSEPSMKTHEIQAEGYNPRAARVSTLFSFTDKLNNLASNFSKDFIIFNLLIQGNDIIIQIVDKSYNQISFTYPNGLLRPIDSQFEKRFFYDFAGAYPKIASKLLSIYYEKKIEEDFLNRFFSKINKICFNRYYIEAFYYKIKEGKLFCEGKVKEGTFYLIFKKKLLKFDGEEDFEKCFFKNLTNYLGFQVSSIKKEYYQLGFASTDPEQTRCIQKTSHSAPGGEKSETGLRRSQETRPKTAARTALINCYSPSEGQPVKKNRHAMFQKKSLQEREELLGHSQNMDPLKTKQFLNDFRNSHVDFSAKLEQRHIEDFILLVNKQLEKFNLNHDLLCFFVESHPTSSSISYMKEGDGTMHHLLTIDMNSATDIENFLRYFYVELLSSKVMSQNDYHLLFEICNQELQTCFLSETRNQSESTPSECLSSSQVPEKPLRCDFSPMDNSHAFEINQFTRRLNEIISGNPRQSFVIEITSERIEDRMILFVLSRNGNVIPIIEFPIQEYGPKVEEGFFDSLELWFPGVEFLRQDYLKGKEINSDDLLSQTFSEDQEFQGFVRFNLREFLTDLNQLIEQHPVSIGIEEFTIDLHENQLDIVVNENEGGSKTLLSIFRYQNLSDTEFYKLFFGKLEIFSGSSFLEEGFATKLEEEEEHKESLKDLQLRCSRDTIRNRIIQCQLHFPIFLGIFNLLLESLNDQTTLKSLDFKIEESILTFYAITKFEDIISLFSIDLAIPDISSDRLKLEFIQKLVHLYPETEIIVSTGLELITET